MTTQPAISTAPTTPGRHNGPRLWAPVGAALFAVAWGGNEFTPLLVMYRSLGHLSTATVDILLGAYVLGIVPALLLGGPLSDRYGRRPLMLPAPLFGAAGSLVLALGAQAVPLLFVGRVLSGIALGLVMAVGTSWIKELSQPPFDPAATAGAGARRASLCLTTGFGLGAGVAAALAQFGPWQSMLPYLVNIALTVAAGIVLVRAPETRVVDHGDRPLAEDLKIPAATHRRFLFVVVPMAPWIFGTAASAYAILPGLLMERVPGLEIGFSGLLCLVALGCGVAAQTLVRRFDDPRSVRAVAIALGVTVPGMLLAAGTASTLSLPLAVAAAAALGTGYGILLVSGLLEIQRIARPDDLAGLTALYYSISYLGFFVPAVLAGLSGWFGYPAMFIAGATIALGCLAVVLLGGRKHQV